MDEWMKARVSEREHELLGYWPSFNTEQLDIKIEHIISSAFPNMWGTVS